MRALFLSTSSNETTKYMESLACLNLGPVEMLRYDEQEVTDANLHSRIKDFKPDIIVYVGSRWGAQPSTHTLAHINANVAPCVHLCSDAADLPWHDLINEYHYAGAFALQVAIDGNKKWPLDGLPDGMTLLTPINPTHFTSPPKPHAERKIVCGYAGNAGSQGSIRRNILTELMLRNLLTVRMRDDEPGSYDKCCEFMSDCRISINIPYSGTQAALQVKGRVIEAGLAGSCLLELGGSPTSDWFKPGEDYVEYYTVGQAMQVIEMLHDKPEATQAYGEKLRARVLAEHSPQVFWNKVFERIGIGQRATHSV
jgi:hypothetical protein